MTEDKSKHHHNFHHFSERELGITQAMIEDFAEHRIPRLLSIEADMLKGELIPSWILFS